MLVCARVLRRQVEADEACHLSWKVSLPPTLASLPETFLASHTARMLQGIRVLRPACRRLVPAGGRAGQAVPAVQGFATEQSSGPGLPGQGTMSEEQVNRTSDRLYEGERVAGAASATTRRWRCRSVSAAPEV